MGGREHQGQTPAPAKRAGFGDALQFARYIPLIAERGAHVVLECQPELKSLFATIPGVEEIFDRGTAPPPFDLSVPLLSLARVFGTTLASIPVQVPYLRPARTMTIPRRPGTLLRVGLVWAGKTKPRDRSWPLPHLAALLDNPRLAFYSLQTGPRAADLAAHGLDRLIVDLTPHLKDFADTAAAMNALDLIVTIDTASAHLAGALGRPAIVLLRYVSDWRWHDYREDSPWYPSLRLVRQPRPDDFTQPMERVREELLTADEPRRTPRQPAYETAMTIRPRRSVLYMPGSNARAIEKARTLAGRRHHPRP